MTQRIFSPLVKSQRLRQRLTYFCYLIFRYNAVLVNQTIKKTLNFSSLKNNASWESERKRDTHYKWKKSFQIVSRFVTFSR